MLKQILKNFMGPRPDLDQPENLINRLFLVHVRSTKGTMDPEGSARNSWPLYVR